ncbi:MAG TPA: hypothetical protein VGY76_04105 [Solirubrobacteraceae bacterium]|jgi:hypothetical protein|nr:hypothetical protein [Solirubrobacteraceae bacterium]
MIRLSIFRNEISPSGKLVDHLAAAVQISGQELDVTAGSARYVQVGMPVYSERYGRMIDFDTDGEEWARNLPSAYRNGAVSVTAEIIEPVEEQFSVRRARCAPALTDRHARHPR